MGFKIQANDHPQVVAKVDEQVQAGNSVAKATRIVSEEYGVTASRVYEIYRDHNPREIDPDDSRAEMLRDRREGMSLKAIAEKHECSTNKVNRVCRTYRLPVEDTKARRTKARRSKATS